MVGRLGRGIAHLRQRQRTEQTNMKESSPAAAAASAAVGPRRLLFQQWRLRRFR
jgi:hypothetical protein